MLQADNPLLVQNDRTVLLETFQATSQAAREELALFADLEKAPEGLHTYRITALSLWNAVDAGQTADSILATLQRYAKLPVPRTVESDIRELVSRYGKLRLLPGNDGDLTLRSDDTALLDQVINAPYAQGMLGERHDAHSVRVPLIQRGFLKQVLARAGFPVADLAGYVSGLPLDLSLLPSTRKQEPFALRDYQQEAVHRFYEAGSSSAGAGVIVLPCGAGKTLVGLGAMAQVSSHTLIICSSTVSVRQWQDEIRDKTNITPEDIGEYTGEVKNIRPVTLTTYQMLTHRGPHDVDFPHLDLFRTQNWGLVIYDEIHLLPAPIFRATAEIQALRRLGLTATLVREDNLETDVFSLVGPRKFFIPWRELERQGWIAEARCIEVRVPMGEAARTAYIQAPPRERHRIAAENHAKIDVVMDLLDQHKGDMVLVIGHYLDHLEELARRLHVPILTGKTSTAERTRWFGAFRRGEVRALITSKIANFSIDLPDANVAIQISGTFGSRQEEAQRVGRLLRPKRDGSPATFYSVVSQETNEQDFSLNRQRFLVEQGYRYRIVEIGAATREVAS